MATNTTNVHGMNVSGSDTSPDQFGHLLRDVFAGSVAGMAVTQNGTPNMNVTVAPGTALLNKNTVSSVVAEVKTATNVVISTANTSNPRIDTIIIYEDTSVTITPYVTDAVGGHFKLASVVGTPAASPTVLSDAAIQTEIGAGKPWTRLADVTVPALTATILNSYISDKRNPITTAGSSDGFTPLIATPGTATYNGNRSYTLPISGDQTTKLSPGMRVRTVRTVAAPTQSASLNGTNQYFSKTTPAGMTFTDDFAVSAWVKLSSYADGTIISRYNGTSGWTMRIISSGQVQVAGFNAAAGNFRGFSSYQSIPLNKWVHIAAQIDMSAYTATSTTMYCMIDGVDVPISLIQGGTTPSALIQAGDLQVGREAATFFFPGKIAQVAIFSAKVTQATMRGYISQGLAGTETSLISAYSFNGVITDLNTTNANNLTANGGAVATNTDSPFGGQANGTISSTVDYGIIQAVSYSAPNTTVTVQVAEGCTIPTSGGVSATSYSGVKAPYGFPASKTKWQIGALFATNTVVTGNAGGVWSPFTGSTFTVPIGSWSQSSSMNVTGQSSTATQFTMQVQWDTAPVAFNRRNQSTFKAQASISFITSRMHHLDEWEFTTATPLNMYAAITNGSGTQNAYVENNFQSYVVFDNAYL